MHLLGAHKLNQEQATSQQAIHRLEKPCCSSLNLQNSYESSLMRKTLWTLLLLESAEHKAKICQPLKRVENGAHWYEHCSVEVQPRLAAAAVIGAIKGLRGNLYASLHTHMNVIGLQVCIQADADTL